MTRPTTRYAGLRGLSFRLPPVGLLAIACGTLGYGAPVIIQQPADQTPFAGQTATFVVQASSSSPITYQWQVNGSAIPGQTNSVLTVFGVSTTQAGHLYTVVATDESGSVTTLPARLDVRLPEATTTLYTWGTHPWLPENRFNAASLRGSVGQVFVVAVYDTNLGSLWGTDIYTDDSSVASAAVHSGFLQRGERGTLRVKINPPQYNYPASNRNGVQSGSYSYWLGSYEIVGRAPTVVEFPASQARMVGGTAVFSVQATGQGTLRYQWSHNSNSLNGATNSSLRIPVTSVNQAGCYSVAITDDSATVVHTAQLVVLPFAAGTPAANPGSFAGLSPGGFTAVLVTGNTNAGTIYGNGFYSDWSDVSAAAVHAGLIAHGQQGVVLVARLQSQTRFSGGMGAGVESVAWASGAGYALLGRAPHILESPLSQIVLAGKSAPLSFVSTDRDNPNFRIQWRRNGETIAGATGDTLQAFAASPGERVRYDVVLSIPGSPSVSLPATVVTPPSTAKLFTVNTAAEAGQYLGQEGNLVYVPVQGAVSGGSIWGTGVYTSDSHLGIAAVHAGLLAPGETGQIAIYSVGSWSGFVGTTRNGVESRSYSTFSGIVLGDPSPAPLQPSIRLTGTGQFLIEGAAGRTCHILASPTTAPGSWLLLDTRKVNSDSELWTDSTAPLPSVRFYRLLLP